MSAIVLGKRCYFDELPASFTTPPSKKLRCSSSSTSPVRFSPSFLLTSPPSRTSLVHMLRETFPLMDHQLLEKALEECDDDIDAAIKRLRELCLGSSEDKPGSVNHFEAHVQQGGLSAEEQPASAANASVQSNNLPTDGTQWVELVVTEMKSATSLDDARGRAAKVLEVFENSVRTQATANVAENYQKENNLLKQQNQELMQENSILKRGILIQQERLKELDAKNQEVQKLEQAVSHQQEQLCRLQMEKDSLSLRLDQAQRNSFVWGNFNRDVC